jgi:histone deacetylase complex regulatory component SIN3
MTTENNDKIPMLASSEKHRSEGTMTQAMENTMEKQAKLTMNSAGVHSKTQRIRLLKDHGKRRIQICFRITPRAWERLIEVSRLFEMSYTDYAKAILYKDLGVWTERLDYRKKKRRK